jgi:thiol-disulfide isomerase/thioredoxin
MSSISRREAVTGIALAALGLAGCGSRDIEATDVEQISVSGIVGRITEGLGEVTVLYVYASWCSACRGAMPTFNRVAAKYRRKVRFVVVSVDEDMEALAEFLRSEGAPFEPLASPMAKGERLTPALAPLGATYEGAIPYGAVFGRDGKLVRDWTGAASIDGWTGTLDPLVG